MWLSNVIRVELHIIFGMNDAREMRFGLHFKDN